jgi:hypothetical protein
MTRKGNRVSQKPEDPVVIATLGRLIADHGMRDMFESDPERAADAMSVRLTVAQSGRIRELLASMQNVRGSIAEQLRQAIGGNDRIQCPS